MNSLERAVGEISQTGTHGQMMVILKLLSMEIALRLGNNVDMPRNLAKSVTVEQRRSDKRREGPGSERS